MAEYKNPAACAMVIIEKEGKILLIERNIEPCKNMWMFPGGFVEYGEIVEHTAIREVKEETGLDIELADILGVYSDPKRDSRKPTVCMVFVAKHESGELKTGDDAAKAKWILPEEIKKNELAFDVPLILEHYIAYKKKKQTFWSSKPDTSKRRQARAD